MLCVFYHLFFFLKRNAGCLVNLWKRVQRRDAGRGRGWLLLISKGHGLASFILGLVLSASQLCDPCAVSPPSLPIRSGSPGVGGMVRHLPSSSQGDLGLLSKKKWSPAPSQFTCVETLVCNSSVMSLPLQLPPGPEWTELSGLIRQSKSFIHRGLLP